MKRFLNRKDYFSIVVLIGLLMFSVYLLKDGIFGNTVDWYSQHVTLADLIRHTMIEQKTLFPDFVKQLLGGCNFYEFSYYGYLRPDVLFACLVPDWNMSNILIGYSVLLMSLTLSACYIFLKENHISRSVCFIGCVFVLASSMFFQSHKQIMFVNYLPFLFMAFIAIDYFKKSNRILPFVICGICIVLHSYFYSVSAFVVCFLYYWMKSNYKIESKKECKKFICGFILIVLITAILTVPTLFVLLQNSKSVSQGIIVGLLFPTFDLKGLLYNTYGIGFTYCTWFFLVYGMNHSKLKPMSWILLVVFLFPLISYVLSGFLYARSKILIPFMPLVLYQVTKGFELASNEKIKFEWYQWILCLLPLLMIRNEFIVSDVLLLGCVLFGMQHDLKKIQILLLVMPLCLMIHNNAPDTFLKADTYSHFKKIENMKMILNHKDEIDRLAMVQENQFVNQTFKLGVSRSSGYTSSYNSSYNNLIFDTLGLNVSINNHVDQLDDTNIFYLQMLSNNVLFSKNKKAVGYDKLDQSKEYTLYKNKNCMPIAYATNRLISEKKFDQLKFPYTLDTLYNNAIVQKGNTSYESKFQKEDIGIRINDKKIKYDGIIQIQNDKTITKDILLDWKTKNEILVIELDVKNLDSSQGVGITINGVKNYLSAKTATYFNENTHFTYVLSDWNAIEILHTKFSKGNYELKNIHMYSMDYEGIKNYSHKVDPLVEEDTQDVLSGKIQVKEDGYFITSIPYSKGFDIQIDGKSVKPERVNKSFLGCQISKGNHDIHIFFRPMGKEIGIMLSALGFFFFVVLARMESRKL